MTTDEVAAVELGAFEDKVLPCAEQPEGNEAHAVIDFNPRLADKLVRERLLMSALRRGWRYISPS